MASGTNLQIRGTTLIISPKGNPFRLQQVLSLNAGKRVPLLSGVLFTEPTQESDRLKLSHRLTPTAGSLELPSKANFPSLSLQYAFLSFNHKRACLSTDRFSIF